MAAYLASDRAVRMAAPDFVRDLDLTDDELAALLDLAADVKRSPERLRHRAGRASPSPCCSKSRRCAPASPSSWPSGNWAAIRCFCEGPIGGREPLKDVARNLDRWVNGIVARVFTQTTVEELARWSAAPVINALSDLYHPCQALADLLTVREQFGGLHGLKLAFVGDGNNVAHSLMLTATRLGVEFAIGTPVRLRAQPARSWRRPRDWPPPPAASLLVTHDPVRGAAPARTPSTPTSGPAWGRRRKPCGGATPSSDYQVNEELFALARPGRRLHALPPRASATRRSPTPSSSARARWSSTRPKTGCTRKRRCC